jgi:hypothetical protein
MVTKEGCRWSGLQASYAGDGLPVAQLDTEEAEERRRSGKLSELVCLPVRADIRVETEPGGESRYRSMSNDWNARKTVE